MLRRDLNPPLKRFNVSVKLFSLVADFHCNATGIRCTPDFSGDVRRLIEQ
jgi:hypothetical protein